jgi:hypothetical protein
MILSSSIQRDNQDYSEDMCQQITTYVCILIHIQ